MEKRVVKIDDIVLDSPLHVEEFYSPNVFSSSYKRAIDGNIIVWEQKNKFEPRTIVSMESGWIGYDTKQKLLSQYSQIGKLFTIYYNDGTSETARYDHENGISFTPLWEGSDTYTVKIHMVTAS